MHTSRSRRRELAWSAGILAVIVAGLLAYKGHGALVALAEVRRTGVLRREVARLLVPGSPFPADVAARSLRYLIIIGPALAFGILLAGTVRTFVSPRWIVRAFGRRPVREQLGAAAAGAPLMLCSCCIAPVFQAVYERSRRLGAALTVALAAPSLNPAALVLTFMLFPARIAAARAVMAAVAVFGLAPVVARFGPPAPCELVDPGEPALAGGRRPLASWAASCLHVAVRTVPPIAVGVAVSMWLSGIVAARPFDSHAVRLAAVAGTSVAAVPIALPTLFEIPLAFTLLAASAPAGVAAAVLFAGPAVNLPSLLTIGRAAGWRVAAALAVGVAALACAGGLLVG